MDLLKNIMDERPHDAALLGMDVGTKTVGLAVSDPAQGMATPLKTIRRTKFMKDMQVFAEIIQEYEIGGYVIGLPMNMDGSEGRRAQSVRDFALEFERFLQSQAPQHPCHPERGAEGSHENQGDSSVPRITSGVTRNERLCEPWIALWDERLSTETVEEFVDKSVSLNKRQAKARGITDQLAACHILQTALDYIKKI